MRGSLLVICGCVGLSLAVSGCSQVKTAFGLEKQVPNEFDVVQNAPLAIPPDFNLRPPRPGAAPTQGQSPETQAKETIFRAAGTGAAPSADAQMSAGENDILRAAGAGNSTGDIRQVISQEDSESHPFDKSFVDRVMFWRQDNKQAQKEVLDPVKETARLEQTNSQQTVNSQFSTPPTIDRKSDSTSFFDRLF